MAAHLFIVYFSAISAITPPVAVASFAAAGIAGANPNRVGFEAVRLGLTSFVIPFLFVYMSGLLLEGSVRAILLEIIFAIFFILLMSYFIIFIIPKVYHPILQLRTTFKKKRTL